jgi:hypothetical protein
MAATDADKSTRMDQEESHLEVDIMETGKQDESIDEAKEYY